MSLSYFSAAPGETFTTEDIGKPVWCVAVLERWVGMDEKISILHRDVLIGKVPPPAPLSIVVGFPLKDPIGTIDSFGPPIGALASQLGGAWVHSDDAG